MAGPIAAAGMAGLLLAAGPRPIASFNDLGAAVAACVRGADPAAGSVLELQFTLTPRGTLAGAPRILSGHAVTSMAAQRGLVATMIEALRRCTPFVLAPAFAAAIAGRPVTLRVLTGGPAVVV